jgi:hypothetical protein
MPGLIWGSKGELLSGGAGVPDGSADGQFLLWNAAAGDWQAHSVTPGDIGAAAAAHTHQWGDISGFVEDLGSGSGSIFDFPNSSNWANYGLGYPEMHCWRYGNAFYAVHGVVKPQGLGVGAVFNLFDSRLESLFNSQWTCHCHATGGDETAWIRIGNFISSSSRVGFLLLMPSGVTRISIHLFIPIPGA